MTPADREKLSAMLSTRSVAQKRKRQSKRKAAEPKPPPELAYEKALVDLVKHTQRELQTAVLPLLPEIAAKDIDERLDAASLPPSFERTIEGLRILFAQIAQEASPEDMARAQADRVDRHVKKQLARLIRISPEFADIGGGGAIDAFVQKNVLLIQDVLFSQLRDVRTVLEEAAREGLRVEEIGERLQKTLGVSERRAVLIARDQTGTLNGQIQQARQQNLGVEEYEWSSSKDERVRDDHQKLHGTRQRWDTPPVTNSRTGARNHPGEDILCRCVAIPIIQI